MRNRPQVLSGLVSPTRTQVDLWVNGGPSASASPSSLTLAEDAPVAAVKLSGSDAETAAGDLVFAITQKPTGGSSDAARRSWVKEIVFEEAQTM